MLWTLIALSALRGLGPLPDGPGDGATGTTTAPRPPESGPGSPVDRGIASDQAASAIAAAFLREYLTINGNHDAWVERLSRYLTKGIDLGTSVSVPAGISQYVDYVQPVGVRSERETAAVTVLAHLLESRAGAYQDGGMLAFVVPLARGTGGLAVSGLPRPASLPMVAGMTVHRPALPPQRARDVAAVARRAVVDLLSRDRTDLTLLGGGRPPEARPFPDGWRTTGIAGVQVIGPPEEPTAQVLVHATPPTTGTRYIVPVMVSLHSGSDGIVVRLVDAGGRP